MCAKYLSMTSKTTIGGMPYWYIMWKSLGSILVIIVLPRPCDRLSTPAVSHTIYLYIWHHPTIELFADLCIKTGLCSSLLTSAQVFINLTNAWSSFQRPKGQGKIILHSWSFKTVITVNLNSGHTLLWIIYIQTKIM